MLGNVRDRRLAEIIAAPQDGERYSGACKDPWKIREDDTVELCKLYSVNGAGLPGQSATAPSPPENRVNFRLSRAR
jgi:hypothetical protein